MRRALVMLVACAGIARADNAVVKVGDYELVGGNSTTVRKGSRSAPLNSSPFVTANVDHKARKIVLEVTAGCGTTTQVVGFDELEARLINYEAMSRHLAKDYKHAAEGFAAAVKADPTWCIAAYNLASAQVKLGHNDLAIGTLKACSASNPVATYLEIIQDPELQPIAGAPEVAAMRSTKPGTAHVKDLVIAYARSADIVALMIEHSGWLSDGGSEIELRAAKTGVLIGTLPVREAVPYGTGMESTGPNADADAANMKRIAARDAKRSEFANKVLADMGFEPISGEDAEFPASGDKWKAFFKTAKLGLVEAADHTVHVLRGNAIVGTGRQRGQTATFYPDASVIVVSSRMGPKSEDGCMNFDELVPVQRGP